MVARFLSVVQGLRLEKRTVQSITLVTPVGTVEEWEVLNIFPFTSEVCESSALPWFKSTLIAADQAHGHHCAPNGHGLFSMPAAMLDDLNGAGRDCLLSEGRRVRNEEQNRAQRLAGRGYSVVQIAILN